MAFITATTLLSVVNYQTWGYRAYYGLPESARNVSPIGVVFILVLGLFMLAVGLLAYWRKRCRTRLT